MKKVFAIILCLMLVFAFVPSGIINNDFTLADSAVLAYPKQNTDFADSTHGTADSVLGELPDDVIDPAVESVDDVETAGVKSPAKKDDNAPAGKYRDGVVLVKSSDGISNETAQTQGFESVTPLWDGADWFSVKLKGGADTRETIARLREQNCFDRADYDYVFACDGEVDSVSVSGNPEYVSSQQSSSIGKSFIDSAWDYIKNHGKNPGGSPDVIVAVIDTGVDYNHPDLLNNIWINTKEIPGNGIDDDGNGIVDDYYGYNAVANNGNPMDDNGHGTHVAGIIAAENNNIGGVGVAYNCKVMCIKAGNSSGYFNNSDIAKAIQYAYQNGASVINMSFGGSAISVPVEEALGIAYNSCVLVAAAGNDGACNNPTCMKCENTSVSYPAAIPYVIGVMSCDATGLRVSSFSNYDHNPYNTVEYDVYAVGESVFSLWPGNKYAKLNGTSMAAPTVSGIAALLRSYFKDPNEYSVKYLQSQIVNTGSVNPVISLDLGTDIAHSVANAYNALNRTPTPSVKLFDYYIDDSTEISTANNGNGVMDAGETVRLYVKLKNSGGVASNVKVTVDTLRSNTLTDPYFTIKNSSMDVPDIGTYSVRVSDEYFEVEVHSDCPNDYLADFNISFTYTNGMNSDDKTVYSGKGTATFNVSNGYCLPASINEDTVFENDRLYIVGEDVIIPAGVTVTFKEGCRIQFYDDREYYNSPKITVYGTLNFEGTKDNMIQIYPSERYATYVCRIAEGDVKNAIININYADTINMSVGANSFNYGNKTTISNSHIKNHVDGTRDYVSLVKNGKITIECLCNAEKIDSCYIDAIPFGYSMCYAKCINNVIIKGASPDLDVRTYVRSNIVITKGAENYSYGEVDITGSATNNKFLMADENDIKNLNTIVFQDKSLVSNNYFSEGYRKYASQVIDGYLGSDGKPTIDVYGSCSDESVLWPHILSVEMFDKNGDKVTTIGKEQVKVRVTFSRAMDTTKTVYATFGTKEPYGDYRIDGQFVSDTVWEGTYTLKASIENGLQKLIVHGACAQEDQTKTVFGKYQPYEFNIDTTAAMSMDITAIPTVDGIELTWKQDDYNTLMGYNIYRADTKDGKYVRLNPAVLLDSDDKYIDTDAEPGKNYWYTFTVVLSDFSESAPAGRISCTALDTQSPTLRHTPVNQGYLNNNLVISCTATDNVGIDTVTLYYRTKGATDWKSTKMLKAGDRYSATIFGSELDSAGLEYYIAATDGRNEVFKGSADTPYSVVIKDSALLSRLGDVDGDGRIDIKDALMMMQHKNGSIILTEDQFVRADFDGDGEISAVEVMRLLQYINGKVSSLEMKKG